MNITLDDKDFKQLISRQTVQINDVNIVLSDIGFVRMIQIIQNAANASPLCKIGECLTPLHPDHPLNKMRLFRFHRGGLQDSLETIILIYNKKDLLEKIIKKYDGIPYWPEPPHKICLEGLTIQPYVYDERIGWDTYIVAMNGAAIGFTNGPLDD